MPRRAQRNSKNQSTSDTPPESPTKSGHLKREDHLIITNWLMIQKNYDAVFGTKHSTKVGRPPKSKVNGYQLMAIHLKAKTKGRIDLSAKQMLERFKNYRAKYRKAHMLSISTGFGISAADQEKGIWSVFEKLDSICPYYDKMDELFGKHANVSPMYCEDGQQRVDKNISEIINEEEDEEQSSQNESNNLVDLGPVVSHSKLILLQSCSLTL